jgi:hypothetical protein
VTPEKRWDIDCKAAIIGVYAVIKLCRRLGLRPEDLLALVHDRVPEFEDAERMGRLVREAVTHET